MENKHKKQETFDLLENAWFFGNFLTKKGKMTRCNSDPAPSSKTNASNSICLLRTPSLPPNLGEKEEKDDGDDEDDGPRMADLIRQAMPCNRLAKSPSLAPCRVKEEVVGNGNVVVMSKLTRRSSLDQSILLPPKYKSSKGMKQNPQHKRNLQRSMSMKVSSHKQIKDFQDLGFKFENKHFCPSVVSNLSNLSIQEEQNEKEEVGMTVKKSPIPKWADSKSSAEDMKAKIKFWARAVASNVGQEC